MAAEGGIVKGRDAGKEGFSGAKNVALARSNQESTAEMKARVKAEFAERRETAETEIARLRQNKKKNPLKDQSEIEQEIMRWEKALADLPREEEAEILRQRNEAKSMEKPSSVRKPKADFPKASFPSFDFKTTEAPAAEARTPKFSTVKSKTPSFATVTAPTPESLEEPEAEAEEPKPKEELKPEAEGPKPKEEVTEEPVEVAEVLPEGVEEVAPKLRTNAPAVVEVSDFDWGPVVCEVEEHVGKGFPDANQIVAKLLKHLKTAKSLKLLFEDLREAEDEAVIRVPSSFLREENRDLWFLGDIHGDYLGQLAAVKYAQNYSESNGREAVLFYLGDLFDRGPHGHLVMLELFRQVLDEDLKVGMVLGNHDEGLVATGAGEFQGMVHPAEFIDWLNEADNEEWHDLGIACVEFFKRVPRAVFLPDGLLITHGGVPHEDCLEGGLDWQKLNHDPHCLQDFTWARMHESKKLSFPNRSSKGHQVGREAFYAFCQEAAKVVGHPVERLLRGHDHFVNGHKWYDQYEQKAVLTLNTRCFHPDLRQPTSQHLAMARWVEGRLPEVHRIAVPEPVLRDMYPEPVEGNGN